LWNEKRNDYLKAEKAVQQFIGPFEGKRRSLALWNLIEKHYFAMRWHLLKGGYLSLGILKTSLREFEEYHGISEVPADFLNIPIHVSKSNEDPPDSSLSILQEVMGEYKGQVRYNLNYHTSKIKEPFRWWEKYDVQNEVDKFGLDAWKLFVIGDALEFGCPDWHSKWQKLPQKVDLAYAALFSLYGGVGEDLQIPWVESSERAWLNHLPGNLYQERLKQLSLFILNQGKGQKRNQHLSEFVFCSYFGSQFEIPNDYKLGYELILLDSGIDLKTFLHKIKSWNAFEENKEKVKEMTAVERRALATCFSMFKKPSPKTSSIASVGNLLKELGNFSPKKLFSYFS
jgi:hypothetical protein